MKNSVVGHLVFCSNIKRSWRGRHTGLAQKLDALLVVRVDYVHFERIRTIFDTYTRVAEINVDNAGFSRTRFAA